MFNPQPFSNPVTIAGEAPSVSVDGQGRSDYWLSTLRHPETPPQQFSLSPISSPATPSSTASNHSRGPELGDVQWSGARENYGSPLAAPDVEGFRYDSHLGDALQPRSPVRSLARLSICSASTSSSGTSSLASRGAYSCSSPESSASSPPVHTNTSMPSADALVPKLEEFEDEDQLMSTPPLSLAGPVQEHTGKRGRGRPRKHPLTIAKTVQKSTKGRSKTGCATCRRRKKKCDEAKPECSFRCCPMRFAHLLTRVKVIIVSRTRFNVRDTPQRPSGRLVGKLSVSGFSQPFRSCTDTNPVSPWFFRVCFRINHTITPSSC